MSPGSADKKPVRLSIYNQTYSLLVSGDTKDIEEAARMVDELMTSLAKARNLDSTRAAVFACLHFADRVRTLERDFTALQEAVDAKSRHISSLLDQVVE